LDGDIDNDLLQAIGENSSHLQSLEFNYVKLQPNNRAAMATLFKGCSLLRRFDAGRYVVDDGMAIALGQCCHKLQDFSCERSDLSDVGVTSIAVGCPALTRFVALRCEIGSAGLAALFNNCHELEEVLVNGCSFVSSDGIVPLLDMSVAPSLRKVDLMNTLVDEDDERVAALRGARPELEVEVGE
jgi:hypothetical protein